MAWCSGHVICISQGSDADRKEKEHTLSILVVSPKTLLQAGQETRGRESTGKGTKGSKKSERQGSIRAEMEGKGLY